MHLDVVSFGIAQYDKGLADKKRQLRGGGGRGPALRRPGVFHCKHNFKPSTSSVISTGQEEGKGGEEASGTKRMRVRSNSN
jgi:hypothetical protein